MKLTRQELYDLVWTEPMSSICKRFGLSDNGLRKHCKSMNIPTPPIGYWAKLQFGKEVEKIPLPDNYEGKKITADLREADQTTEEIIGIKPVVSRQEQIEREIESKDMSVFVVPEVLYAKDPLIIDTKEKHREDMIPWSQRKSPYTSKIKESLNVSVGEKSIDRALCIFSTVINALRFRGHKIKIYKKNEYNSLTYAIVNEEEIQIDLTERRRMKSDATSTRDTEYSGELHFNIYGEWRRDITVWECIFFRTKQSVFFIYCPIV